MQHRTRHAEHLAIVLVDHLEALPRHDAEAVVTDELVLVRGVLQFGELELGVAHRIGLLLTHGVGIAGHADELATRVIDVAAQNA